MERSRHGIIPCQHCAQPAAAPRNGTLPKARMHQCLAELMDELARDLGFEYSTASADIDEQVRTAQAATRTLTTSCWVCMQSAAWCRLSGIQTRIGSCQH